MYNVEYSTEDEIKYNVLCHTLTFFAIHLNDGNESVVLVTVAEVNLK